MLHAIGRLLIVLSGIFIVGKSAVAAFPEKPVRIIVSSAPGGYLDIISRAVAKELGEKFGHPFVVENKAGASGAIGANFVRRAEPDGYTWLAATEAHLVTNKFTTKDLGYDFHRDFVGISVLAKSDQMVVATKSFPASTLPELIELAKKRPAGQGYAYGSWGIGSHPHLFYSKLGNMIGTEFLMIPYKGVAPTMQALQADEVKLSVISAGTARPLLEAGTLRVLAAASTERSPSFPDVPTTDELGLPGLQSTIFMVLLLPKATPRDIVDQVSAAVQSVVKSPDFSAKWITGRDFQVVGSDSRGVTKAIDELTPIIKDSIAAAKITPQ